MKDVLQRFAAKLVMPINKGRTGFELKGLVPKDTQAALAIADAPPPALEAKSESDAEGTSGSEVDAAEASAPGWAAASR